MLCYILKGVVIRSDIIMFFLIVENLCNVDMVEEIKIVKFINGLILLI